MDLTTSKGWGTRRVYQDRRWGRTRVSFSAVGSMSITEKSKVVWVYTSASLYTYLHVHIHIRMYIHTHTSTCAHKLKEAKTASFRKAKGQEDGKKNQFQSLGFCWFFFFQNRSGTDTWLLGRDTCVILTTSCSGERKQQMEGGLHTKDSQACSLAVCQCWYLLEARVHFLLPIRNHNHPIFLMSLKSSKYVLS